MNNESLLSFPWNSEIPFRSLKAGIFLENPIFIQHIFLQVYTGANGRRHPT